MRRFFGVKKNDKILIEGDEYNHLKNVLRLNVGDSILVSLNDEYDYACGIEKIEKNVAICDIDGKTICEGNPKKNIVLFQAIAKREKLEFIVQKATEIGATKVVPFVSEFIVAKPSENKTERLNLIAKNACKQCERSIVPIIEEAKNTKQIIEMFKDFDIVLFANERTDCGEKLKNLDKYKNIAIIVGAEGGFSQKEKENFVNAGAVSISLGKRIFRCETASVAMMSLVSILSEN